MAATLIGLEAVLLITSLLFGPAIGYRLGRGRRSKMLARHHHAWERWELTGDKVGSNPIQQRQCLGCGYSQREEIES